MTTRKNLNSLVIVSQWRVCNSVLRRGRIPHSLPFSNHLFLQIPVGGTRTDPPPLFFKRLWCQWPFATAFLTGFSSLICNRVIHKCHCHRRILRLPCSATSSSTSSWLSTSSSSLPSSSPFQHQIQHPNDLISMSQSFKVANVYMNHQNG